MGARTPMRSLLSVIRSAPDEPGTPASLRNCKGGLSCPKDNENWKGVPSSFILENWGGLLPRGIASDSLHIIS
ncbi:MAG: hypothetical protein ABSB40_06270 [Nitrososphaeria archaeon]